MLAPAFSLRLGEAERPSRFSQESSETPWQVRATSGQKASFSSPSSRIWYSQKTNPAECIAMCRCAHRVPHFKRSAATLGKNPVLIWPLKYSWAYLWSKCPHPFEVSSFFLFVWFKFPCFSTSHEIWGNVKYKLLQYVVLIIEHEKALH